MFLRPLLPWALAGLAGYYLPRWFYGREEWHRVALAAIAGAAVGFLNGYL